MQVDRQTNKQTQRHADRNTSHVRKRVNLCINERATNTGMDIIVTTATTTNNNNQLSA